MNRAFRIGLAILALASVYTAPASAGWGPAATAEAPYPYRPDGPVYDGANIIPEATERQIDAGLRKYTVQTGHTVVVATVPSLGGEAIETFAATLLAAEWTIRGVAIDPGVLVLVAPNERAMRIEVGGALREVVPDDTAGEIIRHEFTPRFRNGDFAGGIEAGVAALIVQLDSPPAHAAAAAEAAGAESDEPGPWSWRERSWGDWANIMAWFLWFAFMAWFLAKGRRYLGGST